MPRPGSRLVSPELPVSMEAHVYTDVCTIERNTSGTDPGGQPLPPVWVTQLAAQPCRYFPSASSASLVTGDELSAIVEQPRIAFPGLVDIAPRDRVVMLRDRDLALLVTSANVETVTPHRAYTEAHLREVT